MSWLGWLLLGSAVLIAPRRRPQLRVGSVPSDKGLALALDLTAAGLRSGRSLSAALALAARAVAAPRPRKCGLDYPGTDHWASSSGSRPGARRAG